MNSLAAPVNTMHRSRSTTNLFLMDFKTRNSSIPHAKRQSIVDWITSDNLGIAFNISCSPYLQSVVFDRSHYDPYSKSSERSSLEATNDLHNSAINLWGRVQLMREKTKMIDLLDEWHNGVLLSECIANLVLKQDRAWVKKCVDMTTSKAGRPTRPRLLVIGCEEYVKSPAQVLMNFRSCLDAIQNSSITSLHVGVMTAYDLRDSNEAKWLLMQAIHDHHTNIQKELDNISMKSFDSNKSKLIRVGRKDGERSSNRNSQVRSKTCPPRYRQNKIKSSSYNNILPSKDDIDLNFLMSERRSRLRGGNSSNNSNNISISSLDMHASRMRKSFDSDNSAQLPLRSRSLSPSLSRHQGNERGSGRPALSSSSTFSSAANYGFTSSNSANSSPSNSKKLLAKYSYSVIASKQNLNNRTSPQPGAMKRSGSAPGRLHKVGFRHVNASDSPSGKRTRKGAPPTEAAASSSDNGDNKKKNHIRWSIPLAGGLSPTLASNSIGNKKGNTYKREGSRSSPNEKRRGLLVGASLTSSSSSSSLNASQSTSLGTGLDQVRALEMIRERKLVRKQRLKKQSIESNSIDNNDIYTNNSGNRHSGNRHSRSRGRVDGDLIHIDNRQGISNNDSSEIDDNNDGGATDISPHNNDLRRRASPNRLKRWSELGFKNKKSSNSTNNGMWLPPAISARDLDAVKSFTLINVTDVQKMAIRNWFLSLGLSILDGEGNFYYDRSRVNHRDSDMFHVRNSTTVHAVANPSDPIPLKFDRLRNGVLLCDLLMILEPTACLHANLTHLLHREPSTLGEAMENLERSLWLLKIKRCPPIAWQYLVQPAEILKGNWTLIWGLLLEIMHTVSKSSSDDVEKVQHYDLNPDSFGARIPRPKFGRKAGSSVLPTLGYNARNRRLLDISLIRWLQDVGVMHNLIGGLTAPNTVLSLEGPIRDGSLFCILVETVLRLPIKPWNRQPTTYFHCLSNMQKASEALRTCHLMSLRFMYSNVEEDIVRGHWDAVLGLLEDIHRFHNRVPPPQCFRNFDFLKGNGHGNVDLSKIPNPGDISNTEPYLGKYKGCIIGGSKSNWFEEQNPNQRVFSDMNPIFGIDIGSSSNNVSMSASSGVGGSSFGLDESRRARSFAELDNISDANADTSTTMMNNSSGGSNNNNYDNKNNTGDVPSSLAASSTTHRPPQGFLLDIRNELTYQDNNSNINDRYESEQAKMKEDKIFKRQSYDSDDEDGNIGNDGNSNGPHNNIIELSMHHLDGRERLLDSRGGSSGKSPLDLIPRKTLDTSSANNNSSNSNNDGQSIRSNANNRNSSSSNNNNNNNDSITSGSTKKADRIDLIPMVSNMAGGSEYVGAALQLRKASSINDKSHHQKLFSSSSGSVRDEFDSLAYDKDAFENKTVRSPYYGSNPLKLRVEAVSARGYDYKSPTSNPTAHVYKQPVPWYEALNGDISSSSSSSSAVGGGVGGKSKKKKVYDSAPLPKGNFDEFMNLTSSPTSSEDSLEVGEGGNQSTPPSKKENISINRLNGKLLSKASSKSLIKVASRDGEILQGLPATSTLSLRRRAQASEILQWLDSMGFVIREKAAFMQAAELPELADGVILGLLMMRLGRLVTLPGFTNSPKSAAQRTQNVRKVLAVMATRNNIPKSKITFVTEEKVLAGDGEAIIDLLVRIKAAYSERIYVS